VQNNQFLNATTHPSLRRGMITECLTIAIAVHAKYASSEINTALLTDPKHRIACGTALFFYFSPPIGYRQNVSFSFPPVLRQSELRFWR